MPYTSSICWSTYEWLLLFPLTSCGLFSVKLHKLHFSKLIEEARKSMKKKAKEQSVGSTAGSAPNQKVTSKLLDSENENCEGRVVRNKQKITDDNTCLDDEGEIRMGSNDVNEAFDGNHNSLENEAQHDTETMDNSKNITSVHTENLNLSSTIDILTADESAIREVDELELDNAGSEGITSSPLFDSEIGSPLKIVTPDNDTHNTKDPVLPFVNTGDSDVPSEMDDENTNGSAKPQFDLLTGFDRFGKLFRLFHVQIPNLQSYVFGLQCIGYRNVTAHNLLVLLI